MFKVRSISWIKAARKEFALFPAPVQTEALRSLTIVAAGSMPDHFKPLKGFGSGLFELVLSDRAGAFRVVYALRIDDDVWVLHAFQKKSKSGIATPKKETETVKERLKALRSALK